MNIENTGENINIKIVDITNIKTSKKETIKTKQKKKIELNKIKNTKFCIKCGAVKQYNECCSSEYCSECGSNKWIEKEIAEVIAGCIELVKKYKLREYIRQNKHQYPENLDKAKIYKIIENIIQKKVHTIKANTTTTEIIKKICYKEIYEKCNTCPVCEGTGVYWHDNEAKFVSTCSKCQGYGTWTKYIENKNKKTKEEV